jgi:4-aminobutyrate aminotransferase
VLQRAFHNGLLLLSCGASTVRFMPPLVAARSDVDEAISLLEPSLLEATESLRAVNGGTPGGGSR